VTALFLMVLSGLWLGALVDLGGSTARMVLAQMTGVPPSDARVLAGRLAAPDGFAVTLFAQDLGGPRLMAMTEAGDILVSVPHANVIVRLTPDRDGDGLADQITPLIGDLDRPHGLALEDGWLFIAEEGAVRRVRYDDAAGRITGEPEVIVADLPHGAGHWTRTIAVGPDGGLYLAIGSSCNVCIERHPWRAAMLRIEPDGSAPKVLATGLRNTVGFDWQPGTGSLHGVDNGRDWLGDDFPPDELNVIVDGGFYGWPHYNGANVADPDFGDAAADRAGEQIAPVHAFAAHVAPLSIRFLSRQRDEAWNGAALVALHGSWNRSRKVGYEVVALRWQSDGTITEQPFLSGFRAGEDVFGRPVGILEAPDGAIYVSDDFAGAIYRVAPTSANGF
jgi:glucose/arabinose dehydrogenase